jgi:hypothetical protein
MWPFRSTITLEKQLEELAAIGIELEREPFTPVGDSR